MTNQQLRQIGPEEIRLLARIAGVELAPERLESLAQQVSAVFQNIDRLNSTELHHIEPVMAFSWLWE